MPEGPRLTARGVPGRRRREPRRVVKPPWHGGHGGRGESEGATKTIPVQGREGDMDVVRHRIPAAEAASVGRPQSYRGPGKGEVPREGDGKWKESPQSPSVKEEEMKRREGRMSSPLRDGDPAPPPLLLDPLLGYLNTRKDGDDADGPPSPPDGRMDVDAAVSDLTTKGYHVVRSVLTEDECDAALDRLWDFVEDVSGGCVARSDPRSWYPST
ncbi:hypothetical protein THAOC_06209, partial [Thalassiosira oceanica]